MSRLFKHQGFVDVRGADAGGVDGRAHLALPPFKTQGVLSVEGVCVHPPLLDEKLEPMWPDLIFNLGGKTLGKIYVGEEGPFQRTFDIAEAKGGKGLKLDLILDFDRKSQIPALMSKISGTYRRRRRNMTRTIANYIHLHRIMLDGRVLADFTRGATVFTPEFPLAEMGAGMNIIGFFQHEFGIGESARCCASAAKAVGIPIALNLANLGVKNRGADEQWSDSYQTENPYAVNLFHLDPPQMKMVAETHGEHFFKRHRNIGYWAWELPEFPDAWLESFDYADEVWVPSGFVREAVAGKSPVPVLVMPHAIEFDVPQKMGRADFGLPAEDFLFLVMYDLNSMQDRKNPQAAIKAFQIAFPDSKGVKLVVKIQNADKNPEDFAALQESLKNSPDIILINRTLRHDELRALQNACDSFVSLHRSEGFGMGLAECMFLGKPVVATNWSGNLEFMDAGNSCLVNYELVEIQKTCGPYKKGQIWAEPDPEHAAWWMKKIAEEKTLYAQLSSKAKERITRDFSRQKIGGMYAKRLKTLHHWL